MFLLSKFHSNFEFCLFCMHLFLILGIKDGAFSVLPLSPELVVLVGIDHLALEVTQRRPLLIPP